MRMMWVNISGYDCYLSMRTINKMKADARREQEQAERKAREYAEFMRQMEMLDRARETDWDFYSDLYKDIYGIRPR